MMLPLPTVEHLIEQLARRRRVLPPGTVGVAGFGDSVALSNELLALIFSGRKRASCALEWSYAFDREALPMVGSLEIVVDHLNQPVCVTRVISVAVMPFDQVDATHAALEGEGDLSLAYWRAEHARFFDRECARIERAPARDMPVVCSEFEIFLTLQ
jgi:uncharacterized protein YhfF